MSDNSKVAAAHLRRCALVYVRQSTTAQVEYNRESTERQYRLAERAAELGWKHEQIKVVDQDLGISGSGLSERAGRLHSDDRRSRARARWHRARTGSLAAGAQ
jgi:hypothetical protein